MFEEEKTVTLRKAIVLGKDENALTYDTINLREPLSGELEKAQIGAISGTTVTLNLIALISKLPRKVCEMIPQTEFRECARFLNQDSADGSAEDAQS